MGGSAGQLMNIVRSWEKLRIVYNAILLAEGLIGLALLRLAGREVACAKIHLYGPVLWRLVVLVGVYANIFYCLGPFIEAVTWVVLKRRMGRGRFLLFGAGLLFSMYVICWMAGCMYTHLSGYLR